MSSDEILANSLDEKITIIGKKKDYQIAMCQDGKFAVTFDTGKLRYRK